MVVALTGFMASGKTSFGRAAAKLLGWHFVDTDLLMEERCGRQAGELFAAMGEAAFRQAEGEALAEALAEAKGDLVLALGGGTVKTEANRALLRRRAKVIWLDTSLDIVMSEIGNCNRPLVKGKTRAEIEKMYEERKPLYRSVADYVFTVDSTDYEKVVEDLSALIRTIPSL